jgi:hypothetical protein
MGADRTCTVSFTDSRGIRHSVQTTAGSLFEAAILALRTLRAADLRDPPGPATVLDIEITNQPLRHRVSVSQVARWVNGPASSPRESMKKVHLRKLLASK